MKKIILLIFIISNLYQNKCKSNFLNSLNIDSYKNPKKNNDNLCPKIKFTCCSNKEKILEKWNSKISNNIIKKNEDYIKNLINLLKNRNDIHIWINNLNWNNENINLKIYNEKLMKYLNKTNIIYKLTILQINLISNIKKQLYCSICDSKNQKYIKKDKILINKNFCKKLLFLSKEFIIIQNEVIIPYLINLNNIFNFYLKKNKIIKLNYFKKYKNCFKNNSLDFKNCKDLCKLFSINNDSILFEGNNEILNYINEKLNSLNLVKNHIKINNENNLEKKINFDIKNKGINFFKTDTNNFYFDINNNNKFKFEKIKIKNKIKKIEIRKIFDNKKIKEKEFFKKMDLKQNPIVPSYSKILFFLNFIFLLIN